MTSMHIDLSVHKSKAHEITALLYSGGHWPLDLAAIPPLPAVKPSMQARPAHRAPSAVMNQVSGLSSGGGCPMEGSDLAGPGESSTRTQCPKRRPVPGVCQEPRSGGIAQAQAIRLSTCIMPARLSTGTRIGPSSPSSPFCLSAVASSTVPSSCLLLGALIPQ